MKRWIRTTETSNISRPGVVCMHLWMPSDRLRVHFLVKTLVKFSAKNRNTNLAGSWESPAWFTLSQVCPGPWPCLDWDGLNSNTGRESRDGRGSYLPGFWETENLMSKSIPPALKHTFIICNKIIFYRLHALHNMYFTNKALSSPRKVTFYNVDAMKFYVTLMGHVSRNSLWHLHKYTWRVAMWDEDDISFDAMPQSHLWFMSIFLHCNLELHTLEWDNHCSFWHSLLQ